jgi:Fibronectin type III domain
MSTPGPTNISQTNVVDASGNINVLVQWFPPSDGGYAITSYRIQYSLTNDINYITKELILSNTPSAVNAVTGQISYLITQLIKGGKYQVRVAAINAFGLGQYSNLLFAFPGTKPATLDSTQFEIYASRGSMFAVLNWIKPYDGGYPILRYVLRYRSITIDVVNKVPILSSIREPASPWTEPVEVSAAVLTTTVTGLTNGTYYQFQLAAVNEVGQADYNGPVVVKPGDIPGPFTANISTNFLYSIHARNNGRIFLEWSPPTYDGGYELENYVIQYKASDDVYFTKRDLLLTQRQIPAGLRCTPEFSRNIVIDYYGDLSANPPIGIQSPLKNDVPYSIRLGVENDVGIRWIPEREPTNEIYATVIPNTFSKPVLDLSATIADGTTKLTWRWNDASLNNGYPLNGAYPLDPSGNRYPNYFVVRYRPYNDLYWHELVYPHVAEKLNVNNTLNSYSITKAETGRDVYYNNSNPTALFETFMFNNVPYNYTNAVRDTSTNVYNRSDPMVPPYSEKQFLENGVLYDFQVAAVNHILRGPDMGIAIGEYAQTRQRPGRAPDPPSFFKIQRASQQATVTWNAPPTDGGYPLTHYRIRTRAQSVLDIIASTGDFPLAYNVIYPTIARYNRDGVGINSTNVLTPIPTVISSRYTDPSGNEGWDETLYPATTTTTTAVFITPILTNQVTLTVGTGLSYVSGNLVTVFSSVANANSFQGTVSAYNPSTGAITISNIQKVYGIFNSTVTYQVSLVNADLNVQLQFVKFTVNVLFDAALSVRNALGYSSELYITDKYSTRPYRPDPPQKVSAQMIKSSEVSGGSGSIFLNWTTPEYAGGNLTVSYSYEIQFAMSELVNESNPDPVTNPNPVPEPNTWLALNFNQQRFGEFVPPSTTITPKTLITAAYSIFESPGGMIGDKFINWIRIRSSAKTLGSGTGATGDLESLWTVCNVITLD